MAEVIQNADIDILLCNETWTIPGNHTDDELKINGYKLHRFDHPTCKHWGSAIYTKNGLSAVVVPIDDDITPSFPCTIMKVAPRRSRPFLLSLLYKPHKIGSKWTGEYQKLLEYLTLNYSYPIVVAGDMNTNIFDNDTTEVENYINISRVHGLSFNHTKPTRVTNTSHTCIDHVLSSDNIVTKCDTYIGWSDHYAVAFNLNIQRTYKQKQSEFKARSTKKLNLTNFLQDLHDVQWYTCNNNMSNVDTNEKWNVFWNKFVEVVDKHAPLKNVKIKHSKDQPWMTGEIKALIQTRNLLHKESRYDPSKTELWKDIKVVVKSRIKSAKLQYYNKRIMDNVDNPKKLWSILKEICPYKTMSNDSNDLINNNEEAKQVNDYFSSIPATVKRELEEQSSLLNTDIENQSFSGRPLNKPPIFKFEKVSEDYVIKFFKHLSDTKATGVDTISVKLLKYALPVIVSPLTELINDVLFTGVFPDQLKRARISPIFKQGNANEVSNYRPISILPAVSKVFERAMADQILEHVTSNNLLLKHQSAYKPYHSTQTALLHMVDSWATAADDGKLCAILALDLSKAFDCLDHASILEMLKNHFGINGTALTLIEDYLTNRTAIVSSGIFKSMCNTINDGIPQGSILGPLLFILTLNDINQALPDASFHMYADDLTVWRTGDNLQELSKCLTNYAVNLFHYFRRKGLKINPSKSQFMIVCNKQKLNQIQCDISPIVVLDQRIHASTSIKILGVVIDQHLTFAKHVENLISKCIGKIKFLWRNARAISQHCKKLLCNALIFPHMQYCDVIWNHASKPLLDKLDKLQLQCFSFILNKKGLTPAQLRKELNQLTLQQKRDIHLSSITWQSLYGNCPAYICDMLTSTKTVHSHNTRQSLFQSRGHTTVSKKAFSHVAPSSFNILPRDIQTAPSLETFRTRYFKWCGAGGV